MATSVIVPMATGLLGHLRLPVTERGLGSGPAYSRYFKQIAKAVELPRP
jgi:hypothetical protein